MHLERYKKKGDAFLHRIIALDEAWARAYELEMKRQSNEWRHYGSPHKTKVRQNLSNVKVMVIFAYDSAGIILNMPCPSIRQSQASTTPISSSTICAMRCGRRDHTFSVKTHQSFCTTMLGLMSLA